MLKLLEWVFISVLVSSAVFMAISLLYYLLPTHFLKSNLKNLKSNMLFLILLSIILCYCFNPQQQIKNLNLEIEQQTNLINNIEKQIRNESSTIRLDIINSRLYSN